MTWLLGHRHPESNRRMVRLIWVESFVIGCAVIVVTIGVTWLMVALGAGLDSWAIVIAAPLLSFFYIWLFLSQVGALGNRPWGLWGKYSLIVRERHRTRKGE